jgi:hypothetical protein
MGDVQVGFVLFQGFEDLGDQYIPTQLINEVAIEHLHQP